MTNILSTTRRSCTGKTEEAIMDNHEMDLNKTNKTDKNNCLSIRHSIKIDKTDKTNSKPLCNEAISLNRQNNRISYLEHSNRKSFYHGVMSTKRQNNCMSLSAESYRKLLYKSTNSANMQYNRILKSEQCFLRRSSNQQQRVLDDYNNIRVKSPYHGRMFNIVYGQRHYATIKNNSVQTVNETSPLDTESEGTSPNNVWIMSNDIEDLSQNNMLRPKTTSLLTLRRERSFHEATRREIEWAMGKQMKLPYLYGKADPKRSVIQVPKYSVKNHAKSV